MDDLTDRLRSLDDVQPPELWGEIERRPRGDDDRQRGGRQRALAVGVALLVTAGGLVIAGRAFRQRDVAPRETPPQPTLQRAEPVTRAFVVDRERQVSCEVELPSGELGPGDLTLVSFSYRNEGERDYVMGGPDSPRVVISDTEGNPLYESQSIYNPKGLGFPRNVEPNETVRLYVPFSPIWAGPLHLEPDCWRGAGAVGDGDEGLGTLVANVSSPGPNVPPADALDHAVARTGPLFETCRPRVNGEAIVGTISPPGPIPDLPAYRYSDGRTSTRLPAIDGEDLEVAELEARCVAYIDENPGFTVVDLWFASPTDVPLPAPSWDIADAIQLPTDGRGQVGRWTLMVTFDSVRSVSPHGLGRFAEKDERALMTVFRPPADCVPFDLSAEPPPSSCVLISFRFDEGGWIGNGHRGFPGEIVSSLPEPLIWFVARTP